LPALDLTEQILLELNKDTLAPTDEGIMQNEISSEDPLKTEDPFKTEDPKEEFPEFKP
jgi:hypothetical protein